MEGKAIHRTQPERDALQLLGSFLIQYGVSFALECNLFNLWLAKYPFGGDLETQFPNNKASQLAAKQKIVQEMSLGQSSDLALSKIIKLIMDNEEGLKKMVEYELVSQSGGGYNDSDESDDKDEYAQIWSEVHGVSTTPVGLGPMMRRNPRARDESFEEQTLRRRRREAMVLLETGRPIEREDIIQRVDP